MPPCLEFGRHQWDPQTQCCFLCGISQEFVGRGGRIQTFERPERGGTDVVMTSRTPDGRRFEMSHFLPSATIEEADTPDILRLIEEQYMARLEREFIFGSASDQRLVEVQTTGAGGGGGVDLPGVMIPRERCPAHEMGWHGRCTRCGATSAWIAEQEQDQRRWSWSRDSVQDDPGVHITTHRVEALYQVDTEAMAASLRQMGMASEEAASAMGSLTEAQAQIIEDTVQAHADDAPEPENPDRKLLESLRLASSG